MSSAKSARELALEGCTSDLKAIALELAARRKIGDDDEIWLLFLPAAQTTTRLKQFEKSLESVGATAGEASKLGKELGNLKISLEKLDERYGSQLIKIDTASKSLDEKLWLIFLLAFFSFLLGSAGWFWFGRITAENQIKQSFEDSGYQLELWQRLAKAENGKRLDQCFKERKKDCSLSLQPVK